MEANLPDTFGPEKNLLWKKAIDPGHSSPVAWGDRMYVQTCSADGKSRALRCYDMNSGSEVWVAKITAEPAKFNKNYNSLASSTPATDGKSVFALFWEGSVVRLRAFDIDGKERWKYDLGSYVSQHGFATSPVVHENMVYVNFDQDGKAVLVAVDGRSGKTVWQATRDAHRACYSMPFVLEREGHNELILATTTCITAYEPNTGKVIWNWGWQPQGLRTVSSPVIGGGRMFVGGGDGGGARIFIGLNLPKSGTSASLAWELKKGTPYVPCPLFWKDHIYCVTDRGMATCTSAANGSVVWEERLSDAFHASPVLANGKVYAVNAKGDFYVFAAEPTYRLIARNPMGEPIIATPAIANGKLIVRGEKHLFCIATGK
jgi:outer membrane protein assembly factor BamB